MYTLERVNKCSTARGPEMSCPSPRCNVDRSPYEGLVYSPFIWPPHESPDILGKHPLWISKRWLLMLSRHFCMEPPLRRSFQRACQYKSTTKSKFSAYILSILVSYIGVKVLAGQPVRLVLRADVYSTRATDSSHFEDRAVLLLQRMTTADSKFVMWIVY